MGWGGGGIDIGGDRKCKGGQRQWWEGDIREKGDKGKGRRW